MKQVLIVGASRGIGLEFVRQHVAAGDRVVATARHAEDLARLAALGAQALPLDVTSAASVAALAWPLDGVALDAVVFNAGVHGRRTQALEAPPLDEFDQVMRTNVLGPMQVLPQLLDALAPGAKLAVLSSRMGSMGARQSPSSWLYRASKAALNSVLKDLSLVLAGRAVCVALHPGWVRTDMGGPGADLDVTRSVSNLRALLARLTPTDNGAFFDHDGSVIPW